MKHLLAALLIASAPVAAQAHNGVAHDPALPAETKVQIHTVASAVERYRDFRVAEREGWKKFGGDEPLMGEHWSNPAGPDYIAGAPIDFSRPSNLMYTDIGGQKVLTGVAFIVRLAPGEALPEGFYGDADHWHVHDFERALNAAVQDRPILGWLANGWLDDNYRNKGDNRGRLAMAHAWVTLPNPDGVFANQNRTLPYLKLGLPAAFADGASEEAARGLHLATTRGCADSLDGQIWIANVKGQAARRLRTACAAAADHVRTSLASRDPATINAMAEHGWSMFQESWNANLTPDQRDRVAAMTEHGDHAHEASHPTQAHPTQAHPTPHTH